MTLYTKKLTIADLHAALPNGLDLFETPKLHEGPRSRKFEKVRLCSAVPRGPGRNYHLNGGNVGALPAWNATWDEHGVWMARLFDLDPQLKITGANVYEGWAGFHSATEYQYPTSTCGDLACELCYGQDMREARRT